MASLTFQIDALAPRAALERLIAAVEAPVVLKLVGARFMSYVDESFRTAGRGKWKRLSWSTLALRKRGGDQPLQDTGMYKQSFTQESDSATFVEVGTNFKTPSGAPLGKIHEYGTGPYIIRLRSAKVLAAHIGSGAHGAGEHGPIGLISSRRETRWLFFGKEVKHPGIPPRPVLPENEGEAETILRPTIEGALERAVKGGAGDN
jgi:phage gpG-like protein